VIDGVKAGEARGTIERRIEGPKGAERRSTRSTWLVKNLDQA
jgi:hypothetical protein